ncbi:hypothetical protein C8A00DRAFT_16240, partial [Chaetomidium leptoderma]
ICLELFQDETLVRMLPCHHLFHARCIADWFLKHHDTCPICKAHYTTISATSSSNFCQGEDLLAQPPRAILAP